jgi:hypothetical protein
VKVYVTHHCEKRSGVCNATASGVSIPIGCPTLPCQSLRAACLKAYSNTPTYRPGDCTLVVHQVSIAAPCLCLRHVYRTMDPFSITIGTFTLLGAVNATAKAIGKLVHLRDVPLELLQLSNEVINHCTARRIAVDARIRNTHSQTVRLPRSKISRLPSRRRTSF